jgi:hypothetical protein
MDFRIILGHMKFGITFDQKKLRITFIKEKLKVIFGQLSYYHIVKQYYVKCSYFMMENLQALFIKLFSLVPSFRLVNLYSLLKFSLINYPCMALRRCLFAFS